MAESKKERDKKLTLAAMLQHFVDLGVLNIWIILHHINLSRASGLAHIAQVHTFEKIVGDLLGIWPGDKKDTVPIMRQAMLGGIENGAKSAIEEILKRVSDDDLAKLIEHWMSKDTEPGRRVTFEQLSYAFSTAELSACVRQAMKMVEILEDAPETTVVVAEDIEEEVEVVSPAAPPADDSADSGDPYDGTKDITSP